MVIHQVVAKLAGAAAKSSGPDVSRGSEKEPGGVESRSAEKDDLRRVVGGLIGDCIEHSYSGRSLLVAVIDHFACDRKWLERKASSGNRSRERGGLCAEVRAVRTAEPACIAVLTCASSL